MSPPRRSRRSRRLASSTAAAPSPDTPPPARLLDLPSELLVRVLSRCDPADIARVAAVSLLFHSSLAEQGIRLRAQERGYELPAQPEGEDCAVRWLCYSTLLCESNPPARLAAGHFHSLFIDGEGRLSSCGSTGYNFQSILGHDEDVAQLYTPTRLPSMLGGERAVSVSAGGYHCLALTVSGAVWSWGSGGDGQLGHGDTQNQLLPKKVEAFAGQRVIAVSTALGHNLALTADDGVWSWGCGVHGRLGHGNQQHQLLPKKVEILAGRRVVSVSAMDTHSLAVTADGAVYGWGNGGHGRLGHGDQQDQLLPKKIEAFAGQRVVAVSAGVHHILAITSDGGIWSWGYGGAGQLGHGDGQRQMLPKKIEALTGRRVVAVSAGFEHSLALTTDGAVWSWGFGGYGQLGHGDEQYQLLPKQVEAFAGQHVTAVSAGFMHHSLSITADGGVFTWGKGTHGCLGHGEDLSNQLLPKKIEVWASRPPSGPASSDGEDSSGGEDMP